MKPRGKRLTFSRKGCHHHPYQVPGLLLVAGTAGGGSGQVLCKGVVMAIPWSYLLAGSALGVGLLVFTVGLWRGWWNFFGKDLSALEAEITKRNVGS